MLSGQEHPRLRKLVLPYERSHAPSNHGTIPASEKRTGESLLRRNGVIGHDLGTFAQLSIESRFLCKRILRIAFQRQLKHAIRELIPLRRMLRTKVGTVCDVVTVRLGFGQVWARLRVRRDDLRRKVKRMELDVDNVSKVGLYKRFLQ